MNNLFEMAGTLSQLYRDIGDMAQMDVFTSPIERAMINDIAQVSLRLSHLLEALDAAANHEVPTKPFLLMLKAEFERLNKVGVDSVNELNKQLGKLTVKHDSENECLMQHRLKALEDEVNKLKKSMDRLIGIEDDLR